MNELDEYFFFFNQLIPPINVLLIATGMPGVSEALARLGK